MTTLALLLGLGAAAGVFSGLFGVGGGLLIVPWLMIAGWSLPMAIGTSLLYVAMMGVSGAITHFRRGNLDVSFVIAAAVPAIAGAQVGAFVSTLLSEGLLALMFAAFLVFAGRRMGAAPPAPGPVRAPALAPTLALGFGVGALSGLFGVGGGLLFVPAQVLLFGIPIKRAVGNSLAAILLTGVSGVAAHGMLGHVVWREGAVMVVGGLVGLRLGTALLTRWPAERLKAGMAWLMFATAGYMAWSGVSRLFL